MGKSKKVLVLWDVLGRVPDHRKASGRRFSLRSILGITIAAVLALSRSRWGIENRLFCVRDVTLREDARRLRTGRAPQVLAAVRNLAVMILRRLGYTNLVQGLEHFMEHRSHAIHLVRHGRIG